MRVSHFIPKVSLSPQSLHIKRPIAMKSCALRASVISITLCCIAWIPIISSGFLLDGEDYVGSARTCDAQPQLLRAVTALAPKPVDGVVCICVDGKLQSIIPTRFGCILCPHNDICMGHECPPFTLTSALTASASITGVLIFVPFSKSNPSNLFHVLFDDLYAIWCSLERIDSVSGRPPYNWLIFPVFSLTPLQFQALEILFPEISRAVSSSPVDVLLGTHSECRIIQGESLHLPESFNTTVLISSPKPDESRDSQFDRFVQAILSTVVPDKNLTQSVLLLSRSNSHRRRLLNEPECALALARLAQSHHLRFEYVTNLSELPLHEQIRLVSSAKMIVGVHGAAMSLATFLPGMLKLS